MLFTPFKFNAVHNLFTPSRLEWVVHAPLKIHKLFTLLRDNAFHDNTDHASFHFISVHALLFLFPSTTPFSLCYLITSLLLYPFTPSSFFTYSRLFLFLSLITSTLSSFSIHNTSFLFSIHDSSFFFHSRPFSFPSPFKSLLFPFVFTPPHITWSRPLNLTWSRLFSLLLLLTFFI